jgi:nicotinate-nucleotide adenylyltransferase
LPIVSARFDSAIDAASGDKPFRLGLFGGTFDPVHIGHMSVAERAREQFELDGVLFIPTGQPVRKLATGASPAASRCAMLEAAIAGNSRFDLSLMETRRLGPTYTIDTLRIIKARYGERARLFFILGADSAAELATWLEAAEIARLVEILSAPRTIPADKERSLVHNENGFIVHAIRAPLIDISSRELRMWAQRGRSLRYLVPDEVAAYIEEQGLYLR